MTARHVAGDDRTKADRVDAFSCGVPPTLLGVDYGSGPDRTVYHFRFRGGHPGGGKSDELRGAEAAFVVYDEAMPDLDLMLVDGVWRLP